ncbi:MAG: TonB-dependent receptor, partial [Prevotellaceae bacterium]|nr:TonB-dependent receptor [Prevotellaceae bacterium]
MFAQNHVGETVELDEVEVVADRVVPRKDGLLIYPRKEELKFAGSGYDVLYNLMLPSVRVDRDKGTVTRLGQEVTLYIDGQKADYREIQNIQTRSIARIEYIDVPSGKYVQDFAAINIITRNSVAGEYYAVDARQNIGYLKGDYNVTAQFTRDNMNYQLFAGHAMTDYNNAGSVTNETFQLPGETITRSHRTTDERHKDNHQYLQFNLRHNAAQRTLGGKLSFVRSATPDNGTARTITYLHPDEAGIASRALTDESAYGPAITLYGNFQLPQRQNLSITLDGAYNRNLYTRDYTEQPNDFRNYTDAKEHFYNTSLNANYNKQLKNNAVLSATLMDFYRQSNSTYTGTADYRQQLTTNEAMAWLGYMHSFNRQWMLNAQLGASWLTYGLKGAKTMSLLSPRAGVMMRYMPAQQHALTLNLNAGNSFPTINLLNSIEQSVNSILVQRGNPSLDMAKMYNAALVYNLFTKRLNVEAMLIGNIYSSMSVPHYYAEGDKVIRTLRSDATLHQYLGVLTLTWNAAKNLNLKSELAVLR